jgi:ADP-heptose:LPS heptosyltransferase
VNRIGRRTRALQWLDRRVGVPVCLLLTLARRVGDWFGTRPPGGGPQRVVFLKLTEQGSTVLAYDALRLAVERVGRENVYLLVFEENRFIVDVLGLIPEANVLTVQTQSAWTMAASCGRRLLEIRRRRIDACIDLEFFARFSAAIAYLTGARRRVGFHAYFGEGPYRGDLLTHRVLYNPHLPTGRTFASLVMALDADPASLPSLGIAPPPVSLPPLFQPSPAERAEVRQLLAGLGVPEGGRLILLNANAGDLLPLRRWAGPNYVALADRLLRESPDLFIAFTGAPEEAAPIEELVRAVASPRCVCLAGRTTLRQLLVVYGLAEVLVTNDSGPAHFAALTAIDAVTLFGPETPLLFAAPGPRSHPLWAGLACSPCINAFNNRQTACRDNACMQAITLEQVFETVSRIHRQRVTPPPGPAASGR